MRRTYMPAIEFRPNDVAWQEDCLTLSNFT